MADCVLVGPVWEIGRESWSSLVIVYCIGGKYNGERKRYEMISTMDPLSD